MKIDVTKIEGYENMTPEEQIKALLEFELEEPKPDYTGYVKKDLLDKANSEAADWKRKYNAQLSEEEQKKQAHDEEIENLRKAVQEMEKEKTITETANGYISMGYDAELAKDTALAMAEGDNMRIIQNHMKFLEAHDKLHEASLIAKTPRPDGAGATGKSKPVMTKEEIMKERDPEKRKALIAENPTLFGLPEN